MNTKKLLRTSTIIIVAALFMVGVSISKNHPPVYGDTNGVIAFTRYDGTNNEIFTINADGTNMQQLTGDSTDNNQPVWSPDGSQIAYVSDPNNDNNTQISVMNADGSGNVQLTNDSNGDYDPAWSPDGSQIAYTSYGSNNSSNIYSMNADGSNQTELTSTSSYDDEASFSPDGSKIIYVCTVSFRDQLCTMNTDGSDQTQLTSGTHNYYSPHYSPDGSKIVFEYESTGYVDQLATMNSDGTNLQVIPTSDNNVDDPSYSPDGSKIVYDNDILASDGSHRIYTINTDGTDETAITANDGNQAILPSWQPIVSADEDSDGSSNAVENAGPNNGDANGDGIPDEAQANVTSFVNPVTGKYTVLQSTCTSNSNVSVAAPTSADSGFSYPEGLLSFSLHCSIGATATVTQFYYGLPDSSTLVVRKYNSTSHAYQTVPGVTISSVTIGGQNATKVSYSITDGGPLDQDGTANGTIVDPVGVALPTATTPDTGVGGMATSFQ